MTEWMVHRNRKWYASMELASFLQDKVFSTGSDDLVQRIQNESFKGLDWRSLK